MQEFTKDYYSILGVSQKSASQQIKSAYYKLAKKHHPDNGGDETKMKEINEAYEILSDIDKKAEYDIWYTRHCAVEHTEQNEKADKSGYYQPHNLTDEEMEALFRTLQKKRNKKYNITKAVMLIIKLTAYIIISVKLNKKFNSNEYFFVAALIYSFVTYLGMFTSAYVNNEFYDTKSNPLFDTIGMYIAVGVLYGIFYSLIRLIENSTVKSILNNVLAALLFVFLVVLCFIIDIIKLIKSLKDIFQS